jgi:hypothetical protein
MDTGNSVRDADPRCAVDAPESAAPERTEAPTGQQAPILGKPARARPPFRQVQDIQELIDKLAAVTRQLRDPRHS